MGILRKTENVMIFYNTKSMPRSFFIQHGQIKIGFYLRKNFDNFSIFILYKKKM